MLVVLAVGGFAIALVLATAADRHERAIARHTQAMTVIQYAIERMAAACNDSYDAGWLALELRTAVERLQQIRDGKA
jgi:hypothetical protein